MFKLMMRHERENGLLASLLLVLIGIPLGTFLLLLAMALLKVILAF